MYRPCNEIKAKCDSRLIIKGLRGPTGPTGQSGQSGQTGPTGSIGPTGPSALLTANVAYVDATYGNNETAMLNDEAHPFLTISAAVAEINSVKGNEIWTVIIKAGVYNEDLLLYAGINYAGYIPDLENGQTWIVQINGSVSTAVVGNCAISNLTIDANNANLSTPLLDLGVGLVSMTNVIINGNIQNSAESSNPDIFVRTDNTRLVCNNCYFNLTDINTNNDVVFFSLTGVTIEMNDCSFFLLTEFNDSGPYNIKLFDIIGSGVSIDNSNFLVSVAGEELIINETDFSVNNGGGLSFNYSSLLTEPRASFNNSSNYILFQGGANLLVQSAYSSMYIDSYSSFNTVYSVSGDGFFIFRMVNIPILPPPDPNVKNFSYSQYNDAGTYVSKGGQNTNYTVINGGQYVIGVNDYTLYIQRQDTPVTIVFPSNTTVNYLLDGKLIYVKNSSGANVTLETNGTAIFDEAGTTRQLISGTTLQLQYLRMTDELNPHRWLLLTNGVV